MVSDNARQIIDGMSRDELIGEINRENRSRFQGDNYAYLKTRLALIDEQRRAENQEQQFRLSEDANRIAREANEISHGASSIAGKAFRISTLAAVVAVVSVVVTVISQCTKP
jgi:hypothetical protein